MIIAVILGVSLPPVVASFFSPLPHWVSAVVTLAGGWTYPSSASIIAGEGNSPGARISRVCCRSWSASAAPSASSSRSGNHSWPGWQPVQRQDCHSWRTLEVKKWKNVIEVSKKKKKKRQFLNKRVKLTQQEVPREAAATSHSPKHLLRLVCLSMKTLAETMFPKGMNICRRSWSPNSCGRW